MPASPPLPPGHATLRFLQHGPKTIVSQALAHSPLRLLLPHNHGTSAWVIAATFGGGLVDGDHISLNIDVAPGATALVGTQASTKVYRCPEGECLQEVHATVGPGALLAILPDPVVCFAGARYTQRTDVNLASSASLAFVDILTAGRIARGERWAFLRYASRTRLRGGDDPLLQDALLLDHAHGSVAARMGRFDAFATVVVAGPKLASLADEWISEKPAVSPRAPIVESVSPLPNGQGALLRIAGSSVECVCRTVRDRLEGLVSLLGDDPWAGRW